MVALRMSFIAQSVRSLPHVYTEEQDPSLGLTCKLEGCSVSELPGPGLSGVL